MDHGMRQIQKERLFGVAIDESDGPFANAVKYFEAVKTGVSQIRGI
jgi:hypothetical protein